MHKGILILLLTICLTACAPNPSTPNTATPDSSTNRQTSTESFTPTTAPTATAPATETATATPEAPIVPAPQDVTDLDPSGNIYKQVGDKIVNADGSPAYQLDSENHWQLVQLKYGEWGIDGNPVDVSLDNLECVKKGTPCVYKMPFPAFNKIMGVTIRTSTTGAIDRVPFLDPTTDQVIGTQDRVWLKTRSQQGQDLAFPYTIQIILNTNRFKNISYCGRQLTNYLTDGGNMGTTNTKTAESSNAVSVDTLINAYPSGVNIDLAQFDEFPSDNDLNLTIKSLDDSLKITKGYYSNTEYQQMLKSFYGFLLGNNPTYIRNKNFTSLPGGGFWPKGWLH